MRENSDYEVGIKCPQCGKVYDVMKLKCEPDCPDPQCGAVMSLMLREELLARAYHDQLEHRLKIMFGDAKGVRQLRSLYVFENGEIQLLLNGES